MKLNTYVTFFGFQNRPRIFHRNYPKLKANYTNLTQILNFIVCIEFAFCVPSEYEI